MNGKRTRCGGSGGGCCCARRRRRRRARRARAPTAGPTATCRRGRCGSTSPRSRSGSRSAAAGCRCRCAGAARPSTRGARTRSVHSSCALRPPTSSASSTARCRCSCRASAGRRRGRRPRSWRSAPTRTCGRTAAPSRSRRAAAACRRGSLDAERRHRGGAVHAGAGARRRSSRRSLAVRGKVIIEAGVCFGGDVEVVNACGPATLPAGTYINRVVRLPDGVAPAPSLHAEVLRAVLLLVVWKISSRDKQRASQLPDARDRRHGGGHGRHVQGVILSASRARAARRSRWRRAGAEMGVAELEPVSHTRRRHVVLRRVVEGDLLALGDRRAATTRGRRCSSWPRSCGRRSAREHPRPRRAPASPQ